MKRKCQFTARSQSEEQDRVLREGGLIYLLFEGTALNKYYKALLLARGNQKENQRFEGRAVKNHTNISESP
jgi:hypothetical protein